MREILFRGKRKDNGEWVESGSIIGGIPDSDQSNYRYYIGSAMNGTWYVDPRGNITAVKTNEECIAYEVDPETVGQYVGYADKNGKKIFEGDILQKGNEMRYVYYYPPFAMYMLSKVPTGGATNGMYLQIFECEVIGNIYDNPDLLEVDHG